MSDSPYHYWRTRGFDVYKRYTWNQTRDDFDGYQRFWWKGWNSPAHLSGFAWSSRCWTCDGATTDSTFAPEFRASPGDCILFGSYAHKPTTVAFGVCHESLAFSGIAE